MQANNILVGFDIRLDLGEIWHLGGSSSVSYGTTKSFTSTSGIACPAGPWTCGVLVAPYVTTYTWGVKGHVASVNGERCPAHDYGPASVNMPQIDSNNVGRVETSVCVYQGFPGWADPGAPRPICPTGNGG